MVQKRFGVILSGCGNRDGAEIHESTMTLLAIHKNGADYQCFAPNIVQHHVLNHLTGEVMDESRNVMIEAARIARGKVKDLNEFDPAQFDGLVIPGGLGAVKNLSNYAFAGVDCRVIDGVANAIRGMYQLKKPIGALCIAPVVLAKVLGNINVTIGHDKNTVADLEKMGAIHTATNQEEVAVDREHKIVTTPCYMLNSRVDQIAVGADKVIRSMLDLMD